MIPDETLRRVVPDRSVALYGDLIRMSVTTALVLVWLFFGGVYFRLCSLQRTDPMHTDFTIFYFSARMLNDGYPVYGDLPDAYGFEWYSPRLENLNLPHLQLVLAPLGWFPYAQSSVLWGTVNLASLAAALWIVTRELSIRWTWRRALSWGALGVACAGAGMLAMTGELTLLLVLPLTLAWRAARRDGWGSAGAWLGLAMAAKLFLLLFLPCLVVARRWRAVGGALTAIGVFVALGLLTLGPSAYAEWFAGTTRVYWHANSMNASLYGLADRLFARRGEFAVLADAAWLVKPAWFSIGAVIGLATLGAYRRLERRSGSAGTVDLQFLLVLLGALLLSPLGWIYYVPLAVTPALALLHRAGLRDLASRRAWVWLPGLAALYVPIEATHVGAASSLLTATLGSVYFWGVFLLWVAVALPPSSRTTGCSAAASAPAGERVSRP